MRNTLVGASTFALDLGLLALATNVFHIPYYISTPIAFLLAMSLNYFIGRRFVFRGTERKVHTGYLYFVLIAGGGAIVITALVAGLVTYLHFEYLLARVLVAIVIGVINYLLNLYVNFKVVGRHN